MAELGTQIKRICADFSSGGRCVLGGNRGAGQNGVVQIRGIVKKI